MIISVILAEFTNTFNPALFIHTLPFYTFTTWQK